MAKNPRPRNENPPDPPPADPPPEEEPQKKMEDRVAAEITKVQYQGPRDYLLAKVTEIPDPDAPADHPGDLGLAREVEYFQRMVIGKAKPSTKEPHAWATSTTWTEDPRKALRIPAHRERWLFEAMRIAREDLEPGDRLERCELRYLTIFYEDGTYDPMIPVIEDAAGERYAQPQLLTDYAKRLEEEKAGPMRSRRNTRRG